MSAEKQKPEDVLFFPELEVLDLAYKKLSENLRIQYVVSRWEAILLRWLINCFQALNGTAAKSGITKYLTVVAYGASFLFLSFYILFFHSRAQHVQSFYMSYYTKINGLEDAPYSKNKRCKVITIYGDPSKCGA
ncbi:MAG: hypothetical protein K1565_19245 [Candidatus Thiodiazotropha sp. (ex. Lucinisca nassula)]|jgi:hypothetical protein|nr:hypothetical protein [Candidatus Thiodiazotropha sp. (ex. Lucinisca nassula)]